MRLAEGSGLEECPDCLLPPPGAEDRHAGIREGDRKIVGRAPFSSVGRKIAENLIVREQAERRLHFPADRCVRAVVQIGARAVRLDQFDKQVIHRTKGGKHGFGDADVAVLSRHVDDTDVIVDDPAVITRRQLILKAVRIDLHPELFFQAGKGVLGQSASFFQKGEKDADAEKSRHLDDQPVVPRVEIAETIAVLADRKEKQGDGVIGERGGADHHVNRIRPGVEADPRLDRAPCQGGIGICVLGTGCLLEPRKKHLFEAAGVFLVPRNLICPPEGDKLGVAGELPRPLAIVIIGLVGIPVDLPVLKMPWEAASRNPAVDDPIRLGDDRCGRERPRLDSLLRLLQIVPQGIAHIVGKARFRGGVFSALPKFFCLLHLGNRFVQKFGKKFVFGIQHRGFLRFLFSLILLVKRSVLSENTKKCFLFSRLYKNGLPEGKPFFPIQYSALPTVRG